MYGAMIGDIVGSKYEFDNIRTKDFPLFSEGCDFTDDTIMTVAVAKAILRGMEAQYHGLDAPFQDVLIRIMQDFGKRYPFPKGGYGGRFSGWLAQKAPAPYGSYGNGSAMRASPCGLAAVTLEEAKALARASAAVTHDHPEGIKGAEAVAAAVFLAKCGKSREEIGRYLSDEYYDLSFTLDSIRDTYQFDASCQGTVPQAIAAFLESTGFEDAIRNAISIGGDSDTIGAITGSVAWTYYTLCSGGIESWINGRFDSDMEAIREQARAYLPEEYIALADEFHAACRQRAETYAKTGLCTAVLNSDEEKRYLTDWPGKTAKGAAGPAKAGIVEKLKARFGRSAGSGTDAK